MPLRYLINDPQIDEYHRKLSQRPSDWIPSAEDAETIRLLQAQIPEWSATKTRILTDEEVEAVCRIVGMHPAPGRPLR